MEKPKSSLIVATVLAILVSTEHVKAQGSQIYNSLGQMHPEVVELLQSYQDKFLEEQYNSGVYPGRVRELKEFIEVIDQVLGDAAEKRLTKRLNPFHEISLLLSREGTKLTVTISRRMYDDPETFLGLYTYDAETGITKIYNSPEVDHRVKGTLPTFLIEDMSGHTPKN